MAIESEKAGARITAVMAAAAISEARDLLASLYALLMPSLSEDDAAKLFIRLRAVLMEKRGGHDHAATHWAWEVTGNYMTETLNAALVHFANLPSETIVVAGTAPAKGAAPRKAITPADLAAKVALIGRKDGGR